jgi:hypothetical protein
MFYEGVLAGGVPNLLAKTMYAAVLGWGPRWETRVTRSGDPRIISIPRPAPQASDLQDLETWITDADPTLEGIDGRVMELLEETAGEPGS